MAGFWGATMSADEPIYSSDLDSVHDGPANAARRLVLHGTDHADLCATGLTMCSMHQQAQEVAP